MVTNTNNWARLQGELSMAAALIAIASLILYQCYTSLAAQGAASGGAMQNAAMYPNILATTLIALSLVQVVLAIKAYKKSTMESNTPEFEAHKIDRGNIGRAIACAVSLTVYLVCLKYVGYALTTPILLACMFAILGVRSPIKLVVIPVSITIVISLIFQNGFNIILPVGRLGLGL